MNFLSRIGYRFLIVIVLVVGLVLATVAIPLDIAWAVFVTLREVAGMTWAELAAMYEFNKRELRAVLHAFAEAMRRGQP